MGNSFSVCLLSLQDGLPGKKGGGGACIIQHFFCSRGKRSPSSGFSFPTPKPGAKDSLSSKSLEVPKTVGVRRNVWEGVTGAWPAPTGDGEGLRSWAQPCTWCPGCGPYFYLHVPVPLSHRPSLLGWGEWLASQGMFLWIIPCTACEGTQRERRGEPVNQLALGAL